MKSREAGVGRDSGVRFENWHNRRYGCGRAGAVCGLARVEFLSANHFVCEGTCSKTGLLHFNLAAEDI